MELNFFDMLEVFAERFRNLKSSAAVARETSGTDKMTAYESQKLYHAFQQADDAWHALSQKAKEL